MLYDCKEDYVPLEKEISHLKDYTTLNELQIEKRGIVTFKAEDIPTEYSIAPLILMVFIENAFKHSTASQSSKIRINIEIKVTNDGVLEFECKNTFEDLTNTEAIPHGIGLKNVKKRLDLLYPAAHQLTIRETDNWYIVNLSIRLKK
jgi:sensor histidine kinase YesM